MATELRARFKKDPSAKDFDPKKDIDWEPLAKRLKVKLVSYGGVHFSEASMRVPGVFRQMAIEQGKRGGQGGKGQGQGQANKVKLPLKIWARSLEDGSMILVREDGQVWLDGPEFVNITASKPQRFADILANHALHGLTPAESQVYDEQDQNFRLTSEGGGVFSGYDLFPALLEARAEGLDLQLEDAGQQPITWVFGARAGADGGKGNK